MILEADPGQGRLVLERTRFKGRGSCDGLGNVKHRGDYVISNGYVLLGREVPEVRAGTGRVLRAVCRFQVLQYSRMPSGQETCLLALLEELLHLIRWAEDPHFPPEAVPFQAVAKFKTLQKLLQLTLLVFMEANTLGNLRIPVRCRYLAVQKGD